MDIDQKACTLHKNNHCIMLIIKLFRVFQQTLRKGLEVYPLFLRFPTATSLSYPSIRILWSTPGVLPPLLLATLNTANSLA